MFKLNDISIRSKLILMQVFTSLIVLGIFVTVFLITDINSYKQRKVDSMISLAQVIGSNSVSTLQFQDNEAAKQILSQLRGTNTDISFAEIIDKDSNVFARYFKTSTDSVPAVPSNLEAEKFVFTGNDLFISNTIMNDAEAIGKVVFKVELSELAEIIAFKYKITVVLLITALAFSFLIAVIVQVYISRRLLYLVNTMKAVSLTGDYHNAISDNGKDEISTMIHVFNTLMGQVEENQRRKDEFISIASHELKTPLTSIKGYAQILNEAENKPGNKYLIQKTLDNVNKLERLIKDLLDVSKIQTGQLELNMKEFNLDSLIDETVIAMQVVSLNHTISRETNLNNEIILADRQRIEQVLINLLSNAVKYSPNEKNVFIYSERNGKEIIVRVRDFGIGILAEERQHIFERFYRSKNAAAGITGFGLGLYICRDIIHRHHGKIWVKPEDKGSSFYFSLPVR